MKKVLIFILSILMVTGLCCTASASELDYVQSAELSYTVDGNFMVYIPMNINVGETVQISADVNIPDNKLVSVRFDVLNSDGTVTLTNENGVDTILVYFTRDDGTQIMNNDRLIGTFGNYSEGVTYTFSSTAIVESTAKAGTYTGNVNFCIGYIDAY